MEVPSATDAPQCGQFRGRSFKEENEGILDFGHGQVNAGARAQRLDTRVVLAYTDPMSASSRIILSACVVASALTFGACQQKRRLPVTAPAAQKAQTELEQIQTLEERRSLGAGQLDEWALSSPDPVIRSRALLALARIGAPQTAGTIGNALKDPEAMPRTEAAFAAGSLGTWIPLNDATRDPLVEKLLAAEANEADLSVRQVQLEALGKLATPAAVDRLVERLYGTPPEIEAQAALSLGVAAKRGAQLPPKALTALSPLMKPEASPAARFGAAYALAMSKLPAARPALLLCTQDEQSEVRINCARGLGEVGTDIDAVTLRKLMQDPDYRVVVEATRALAKLASRCKAASCPAIGALADLTYRADRLEAGDVAGGGQPILALAQQGLPASGRSLLTTLRGRIGAATPKAEGTLKDDLATLDCRLAAAMDRQGGKLEEVLNCGSGLVPEERRLALGLHELAQSPTSQPDARVVHVLMYLQNKDGRVKSAALEVLGETKSPSAAEHVRPLIGSDDLPTAVAAASAAGKLGDKAAAPAIRRLAPKVVKSPEYAEPIADALASLEAKEAEPELRAWMNQPHPNLRIAAAKALTRLTGQPVEVPHVEWPEVPFRKPYLPKTGKLLVRTEKGDIEIALFREEAPLTSANIWSLAEKGFYRNLTFHRVVPDFVVQGGDPRGDGEGGPGYMIPCEINRKKYLRGVVGMALSGPDTGGSQFFITHSPQPHLDGRYTAFGEVVNGREVVDRLIEGDKILEVRQYY